MRFELLVYKTWATYFLDVEAMTDDDMVGMRVEMTGPRGRWSSRSDPGWVDEDPRTLLWDWCTDSFEYELRETVGGYELVHRDWTTQAAAARTPLASSDWRAALHEAQTVIERHDPQVRMWRDLGR